MLASGCGAAVARSVEATSAPGPASTISGMASLAASS
jgi:hypothetical protein